MRLIRIKKDQERKGEREREDINSSETEMRRWTLSESGVLLITKKSYLCDVSHFGQKESFVKEIVLSKTHKLSSSSLKECVSKAASLMD